MLITENQLDEWVRGNARDAQGTIVELVWRLTAASCPKPRERRFPLGDSIGQHGPDGVLDVALSFDPFVPEGRSYWEIGTGLKAGDKATQDYKQLTEAVPESIRLDTTFVFVTPRSGRRDWEYTWKEEAQASWLEDRRKRGEWKEVQIIDGTKLVDWLHHFPPVELWLAQVVSRLSGDQIEIPEQRWNVIKSIGEPPPLRPDLFLENRDQARTRLKEIFDAKSVQLKLATHYPNQVVDFVSAYLASLDDESQVEAAGRCLIVSTSDAWKKICSQCRGLVLIADVALDLSGDVGTTLIQKARRAGHAVIFGGPHGGIPDPASIPLLMPRSHQVQKALERAGYSEERARTLAHKSDGNLASLLRCIQNLSVMPEWAERAEASELAIAMVLGSWSDKSDSDCTVAEELVGKAYGEWLERIRNIALHPATPLIHQDGRWKFISRYEGWYALGPRLFDEHLDRVKVVAVSTLREEDPQFELPSEEQYMASIHGKVLSHSHLLRKGLAETLALLGSHPKALKSCSIGKAEATAILAVREILADAEWKLWASLNDLLPLLAEAAPGEFLSAVEEALQSDPCPFDELFAQESSGVAGRTYMSGLLWALETLAWDSDFPSRVVICLGALAARDPGGQWANRPANSLNTIFLPWLPQTCTPLNKRVAVVRTLLMEFTDIGWELLVSLLPRHHSVSSKTRRPAWRVTIPDNWHEGVTRQEYWEQVFAYAELAIGEAKKDVSKLAELIEHLENLPQPAHEQLLNHLRSDVVLDLPEADRLHIWNQLVNLTTKHQQFADAEWALKPEQVDKIAALANQLTPDEPFFRHQRLFSERDFELYEQKGNYEVQMKELERRRQRAIIEVAASGGTEIVIAFAKVVESPWRVGIAFGAVADPGADSTILPALLDESEQREQAQFVGGFVWGRFHSWGWEWVYSIETSQWTSAQIGLFLSFLPFTPETWECAKSLLGEDQSAYWNKTSVNPFQADKGLEFAVDQLLEHGRPFAAIRCIYKMLHDNQPYDRQKAIRTLLKALKSSESPHSMDIYETVEIIKALERDPDTKPEDLFRVEWAYLPLLNEHHGASPEFLWRRLAEAPKFFCEVIRLAFHSEKEEYLEEITEERENHATNAYRLLSKWCVPPGLQKNGSYDGEALNLWLETVKKEYSQTGHLEIAMTMVGHVLIYVPADPDGLWIHHSAAAVLNEENAQDMRTGFYTELYNSRGVHWVDPTGRSERELAAKYRKQAEAVENAGYYRLASILRELAYEYEREAQRISSRELHDW